ncbi:MAG TPA: DUF3108 domain-containing protein, partial [Bacteroidota bacterium]|nr:DUF3108 domain-containing protein [Bacteroidota bacterium]
AAQKIVMVDRSDGKLVRMDSVFTRYPCYDAITLFMFARQHAGLDTTVMLPTVNDYEVKPTLIRFTRELEDLAVDALPGSVEARKIDGNALWVGKSFAGMKGPFRGWISNDEAAIPLRAEIEIFLGSVVMELESYERRDWWRSAGIQQAATH